MKQLHLPILALFILQGCSGGMPEVMPDNSTDGKTSTCPQTIYYKAESPDPFLKARRNIAAQPAVYRAESVGAPSYAASCNTAAPSFTSGTGTAVTISGKAEYEDRTYTKDGFSTNLVRPIRYGTVEALVAGSVVATAVTDADGAYSLSFNYTPGDVSVRAVSKLGGETHIGSVMDHSDNTNLAYYAVTSETLTVSAGDTGTVDLCTSTTSAGPAFNIMDNIVDAQYTANSLSSSKTAEEITAFWYDGSTDGTYYCVSPTSDCNVGTGHTIYILGKNATTNHSGDHDDYDDSVILHELGHYIAVTYSKDDSPGGNHTFTGHYDLRLTWSEGWASFYQSLVKDTTGQSEPEYYVDHTISTSNAESAMTIELETPSNATWVDGPDNELSVASILWDIYDDTTTGDLSINDLDPLDDGASNIWSIFETDLPQADLVSFESFYDGWIGGSGRTHAQIEPLLTMRSIDYSADSFESDDTTAAANELLPCNEATHTLFPKGDKDFFKITVSKALTYVFFTKNLDDGADTALTLYDSDGTTQIDYNDDETVLKKSSKITWTATGNKTVYLLAEPYRPVFSNDPPTLANYGTYSVAVDAFQ